MHKYCKETTLGHPVSQCNLECKCSIKSIIETEGGKGHLFDQDLVLNLDAIEAKYAKRDKRNKKKTMDVFLGISENNRNKKIVLVDFKFNINNPKNLTKAELVGKVNDSIDIIGSEIPIYKGYFFVFSNNICQQSISHINRLFIGNPNSPYKAVSENDLFELYWA